MDEKGNFGDLQTSIQPIQIQKKVFLLLNWSVILFAQWKQDLTLSWTMVIKINGKLMHTLSDTVTLVQLAVLIKRMMYSWSCH